MLMVTRSPLRKRWDKRIWIRAAREPVELGCRARPNLLESYLCFSAQEVGIQEQAGYAERGQFAASKFAHAGLLYLQDSFQVTRAVSAALDQLQNVLM